MTGKYHEERTHNGRRIVIDAAQIGQRYEIMVLYSASGDEIASTRTDTEEEAKAIFDEYCRLFPDESRKPATNPARSKAPAPLTGKYAQLRDDLKKALAAGRAAQEANPEDGGTCNFDAAALRLPRWQESKVEQAAKEAGTSCFSWMLYGGKRFVFGPDTHAQANARSRNAEAMTAALRSMGYEAFDYCQMD